MSYLATRIVSVDPATVKTTYQANTGPFTAATSATDFFEIYGSSTKTIKILKIVITPTNSTAASFNSDIILLIKRSTANTGGTSVAATAIPLDSNNAAATPNSLKHYTANPSALGTAVGTLFTTPTTTFNTSVTGVTQPTTAITIFDADKFGQAIVLRGTAQGLALNLNGVTQAGTTPIMDVTVIWTEE